MKQFCKYVRGLSDKLRVMGFPVEKPTYLFDTISMYWKILQMSHSTLKKKSLSIAFRFVREGVTKPEWPTTSLNTHLNPAGIFTKSLPRGEQSAKFTSYLLYYVGD